MHTHSIHTIRFLTAVGAFALSLAASDSAEARTHPAQGGHVINQADASCFAEAYGSTRNVCAGSWRYWVVPLVMDNGNDGTNVAPTVSVFAPSASERVGCYAYGVSHNSATTFTHWSTATWWPAYFGAQTTLALGTFWVPASGYGMIVCKVDPNGQLNGVRY